MQSSIRNTLLVGVALGLLIGLGGYTFIYSKGYSYLTNNPAACANCHVMRAQYDAWLKSSHRSAATCNDCHTPHNVLGKYCREGQQRILALVLLHDWLVSRHHRRSRRLGEELPHAIRPLSAYGRHATHQVRRQRGHASLAHPGRSALRRRPFQTGAGSTLENHMGPDTRSPPTTASAAATPTCSMTRPSPSGRNSRRPRCAPIATPPS
jgi:hypothetical protein